MARWMLIATISCAAALIGECLFAQDGNDARHGSGDSELPGTRTVIGPTRSFLSIGADALVAGRYEEGVRLTLRGLQNARISARARAAGLTNLCAGYAALNESNQAIEYCTQSIALNEDDWRAWGNRSFAYWLKGEYGLAGADLERATSLNENARSLFRIRGMLNESGLQPRIEMEDRQ